jgi:hypothetical protein
MVKEGRQEQNYYDAYLAPITSDEEGKVDILLLHGNQSHPLN